MFEKPSEYPLSEQFLGKLSREIWRLHEAQYEENIDEILDHGINGAITAWHLSEIVAVEFNLNKVLYRETVKSICPDLGLMHDIATYAKHVHVTKPQRQNINETLQLKTIVRPSISEKEWKEGQEALEFFGISFVGDNSEYSYRPYRPLIVEQREVEEILVNIELFWRRQIEGLRIKNV